MRVRDAQGGSIIALVDRGQPSLGRNLKCTRERTSCLVNPSERPSRYTVFLRVSSPIKRRDSAQDE